MTEDEIRWRNGADPLALLDALHPAHTLGSIQPQNRQSRKYLLACARRPRVWDRLPEVSRALVDLAEGYVDAPGRNSFPEAVAQVAARLMHCAGEPADLNDAATDSTSTSAPPTGAVRSR